METRDALDYLGNKVGEVTLPDGTSEDEWAEKLAVYAKPPPTPEEQLYTYLSRAVAESHVIADEIIQEFKKQNLAYFIQNAIPNDLAIMMSLHVHHRLRAVDVTVGGVPFTIDVLNLVISGDLETAWVVLSYMTPDDMSMPYHFLSSERINTLRGLISARVMVG